MHMYLTIACQNSVSFLPSLINDSSSGCWYGLSRARLKMASSRRAKVFAREGRMAPRYES